MKYLKTLILAVLAGISIGFGGIVYLACENKVVGSVLFTIGLFIICTRGYNLFTGKVGYLPENIKKGNAASYSLDLILIWLGNLIGTGISAFLIRMTRFAETYSENATSIIEVKTSNGQWFSVFLLGIFCNILMFVGVDGFKNNKHELGKYLGLFFAVVVFILAGFEHCIANMFYIWISNTWGTDTILLLFFSTLGNIVGGVLFPILEFAKKEETK